MAAEALCSPLRSCYGLLLLVGSLLIATSTMVDELFEECAALSTDKIDEETIGKIERALDAKSWTGVYALPLEGTETATTTPVYRCVEDGSDPKRTILAGEGIDMFPEISSLHGLLKFSAKTYGPYPYLGERKPIINEDNEVTGLTGFKYFTFGDTLRVVEALGRALDMEVGVPASVFETESTPYKEMRILGVWSRSRLDWRLIDFAANYRGIVTVPLYDTLGEESVDHIVSVTKMQVMACEGKKLEAALKLKQKGMPLKAVISFDPITGEQAAAYKEAGVELYYQRHLRRKYLTIKDCKSPEELPQKLSDVATIIYTSGTTGCPKGAIHTNGSLLSMVGSYLRSNNRMRVAVRDSTLSYLPLSHIYQRGVELVVAILGVKVGYYSGDLLKITEDLQQFKPTIFVGVPRVFSKILGKIKSGISEKPSVIQWLAGKALASKKSKYASSPSAVSSFLPDLIFRKVRATFGGNIRTLSMGSAPMDSEQLKELQLYLSASICEGWGMTETGIAFLQDVWDSAKGSIGGPLPGVEYKVESKPDLQYDAKGTPQRGELLVRGPGIMKGYFLDPERTAEALDSEGWLRTGDIVEVLESGAVKIIDRAKNIFKLAHGEYIAPERLENIYISSCWVEQIFIHGDSLQACLVAVIVPAQQEVLKWAKENGKEGVEYSELLQDPTLKEKILADLETLGRKQLKGFELIKAIHLVAEPFSVENQLVTPTMKVIRPAAASRFRSEISALYSQLNDTNTAATVR